MSIGIATSGFSEHSRNGLKFRCWSSEGGRLSFYRKPSRSAIPRRGQAVSACPTQQRVSLTAHFSAHRQLPLRDPFRLAGLCRCGYGSPLSLGIRLYRQAE